MKEWETTLSQVLKERRETLGDAPSLETMLALREGTLKPQERAQLLERAAVDPVVARQLFGILMFPRLESSSSEEDLTEERLDELFEAFRERTGMAQAPVALSRLPSPPQQPPGHAPQWLPLAAAFFLGVSLTLFGQWLLPVPSSQEAPQVKPNLSIVELEPTTSSSLRGSSMAQVAEGIEGLVVVLALPEAPASERYVLKIQDQDSEVLWSTSDLRTGTGGLFVLSLPLQEFPEGIYRLTLVGESPDDKATYFLEIPKDNES